MIQLNNKFAIGCLIQWYEIELIPQYLESVKQSLNHIENKKNVIIDLYFNDIRLNQNKHDEEIYTIADYRRDFNDKYCEKVDVLMWGESDSLIPRQTFQILDSLHTSVKEQTPKYVLFFGTCKMWDESWYK